WYADLPLNFLVFKLLAKFLGAPLIAEKSEFPFVYSQKSLSVRMKLWFNEHVTYRLIDGVIVISTFLQEFFETHSGKSVKILNVPILVESGIFEQGVRGGASTERSIIYCGNLEHVGEVEALLQAFSQVADEFSEWRVQVIGPLPQRRTEETLHSMIVRLGLDGRVDFTGAVARSAIPCRLAAGDIMALPRASGIFSTAGFPTKLGEYLATGKPVVVTDTGDISRYLQNGVNAYLAPPDDTAAFARALRYVMLHPEEARVVGCRGKQVAESEFNSYLHCARVIEFVVALRKVK
ncbi:MAG: glycosyltransferase, partial [Deltaproteobacteria bacterium]